MAIRKIFLGILIFSLGVSCFAASCTKAEKKEINIQQSEVIQYRTSENLLDAYLSSYDLTEAVKKELCKTNKKLDDKYIELQALYKKGFSWYLEDILSLSGYDKKIEEYGLKESEVQKTYDFLDSPYFYLISNCYIERLDEKDLKELQKIGGSEGKLNKDSKEGKELIELAARTYSEVVCESKADEEAYKFYFNDNTLYETNSHSILLGLGIKKDSAVEWTKRKAFLKDLKSALEKDAKDRELKAGLTVLIFEK